VKKFTAFLLVLTLVLTIGFPALGGYDDGAPVFDPSLAAKPTAVVGRVLTPSMTGDKADWIEIARNGKYSLIIRKEFIAIYPNKVMYGKDVSRDPLWQYTNGYYSQIAEYRQSVVRTHINRWFNGENWSATLVGEHDRLPVDARLRAFTMQVFPSPTFLTGTSTTIASLDNGYSKPSKYQVGMGDDVAFALSFGEASMFLSKCSYHRDYYEVVGGKNVYVATRPSSDVAIANYNRMVFPTFTDCRWGIWLRSPGDIKDSIATLDAAPPAPLQGGAGIGRVFQFFNTENFRGYIYPACWVDQEIFTNSTKTPPAPVTVVPTGVDGRILPPELSGDTANWIEIARCGDASLIVRQKFLNTYIDKKYANDTAWQSCVAYAMPQRDLNPPPVNSTYNDSYPRYFINLWFSADPRWLPVYGGGYLSTAQLSQAEKLPLDARLRDFAMQGTMKHYIGTCCSAASLTDGLSRPTLYQTGVGDDVAFALSYSEAANFLSKLHFMRGVYIANQESNPIARANYAKLDVPYYIPNPPHRWGMWLRSVGDVKDSAGELDMAPSSPLVPGGVSLGRVFQEYTWERNDVVRGLVYPAMWVGQGIFGPVATGHTVKGLVSPLVTRDVFGIGDSFMKAHEVVVELRSTFNTPAPASLRTVATLKDNTGLGEFTFTDVPDGDYVLWIHRPGYLTRAMKVTISGAAGSTITLAPPGTTEGGVFRLWYGDSTDDLKVDNDDILMILEMIDNGVNAFSPLYKAACDLNADGLIDFNDILMVLDHWNDTARMYPGAGDVNFYG